jgi:hypothetical protein
MLTIDLFQVTLRFLKLRSLLGNSLSRIQQTKQVQTFFLHFSRVRYELRVLETSISSVQKSRFGMGGGSSVVVTAEIVVPR